MIQLLKNSNSKCRSFIIAMVSALLKLVTNRIFKYPYFYKTTVTLIVLIIFSSCKNQPKDLALPFYNNPDFTPEWINKEDSSYKNIHTIPPFSFTDQDGKTITEKTMDGKIYVVDFIFTRCGSICPTMTKNLEILQEKFSNNNSVLLLSYSVTPDMDSVQVLKKYALKNGIISSKWHLLTGDKNQIYDLAKKHYFAGDKIGFYEASNEFLHTENVLLIDKYRRIRGVYNGTLPIEMDRLADDILTLEKEII